MPLRYLQKTWPANLCQSQANGTKLMGLLNCKQFCCSQRKKANWLKNG